MKKLIVRKRNKMKIEIDYESKLTPEEREWLRAFDEEELKTGDWARRQDVMNRICEELIDDLYTAGAGDSAENALIDMIDLSRRPDADLIKLPSLRGRGKKKAVS